MDYFPGGGRGGGWYSFAYNYICFILQAFDDVERKVKPKENPIEYKKRIVLDQEKSKLSLGEVYEQEYVKQQVRNEMGLSQVSLTC